ncbi:unnamed protein product [Pylaiella littoralis]
MASSLHRRAAINLMFCASVLGAVVVRESPLQLKSLLFHSRISTDTFVRRRTTFVGRGISGGDLRTGGVLAAAASSPSSSFASSSAASAPGKIVTICGEAETEETIKKSRFIGRCGPAATFEDAKALLGRVSQEHPKARHSCWAWRGLGDDHRFSDDGEPGGTAGLPILGGIESEGISEVAVVVTRYSGGIKLGTGGLCRAYGGASRLCLQAAERETRTPVLGLTVTAPVESVGSVYHAVSDCRRLSEEFTADGSVILRVKVEVGQVDEVRRRISDATKGAAEIVEEE